MATEYKLPFDDDEAPSLDSSRFNAHPPRRVGDAVYNALQSVRDALRIAPLRMPPRPSEPIFESRYAYEDGPNSRLLEEQRRQTELAEWERKKKKVKKRRRIVGFVAGGSALIGSVAVVAKNMLSDERVAQESPTEQVVEVGDTIPEETTTTFEEQLSPQEVLASTDPVIVVASEGISSEMRENHYDSAANLDVELDERRLCEVVDVDLPAQPQWEGVEKGALTDFAITTEEFDAYRNEVASADSFQEIQDIYQRIIGAYNVNVKYDNEHISDYTLDEYKGYIIDALKVLTLVPADLVQINKTHTLILRTTAPDTDIAIGAAGTYTYFGSVELNSNSALWALIHEWGHALQDYACEYSDATSSAFSVAYNEAMAELATIPRFTELNMKYEDFVQNGNEMSAEDWDEYNQIFIDRGLVSPYAGRNPMEMFAVIFDQLVKQGYVGPGTGEGQDSEIGLHIQEAVMETMAAAMPDTDIASWLQFVSYYYKTGRTPDVISPEKVVQMKLSPLDAQIFTADQSMQSYPAIALTNGDHAEFIYATVDNNEASITIRTSNNAELDESLKNAAIAYLESVSGKGSTTVSYTKGAEGYINITSPLPVTSIQG